MTNISGSFYFLLVLNFTCLFYFVFFLPFLKCLEHFKWKEKKKRSKYISNNEKYCFYVTVSTWRSVGLLSKVTCVTEFSEIATTKKSGLEELRNKTRNIIIQLFFSATVHLIIRIVLKLEINVFSRKQIWRWKNHDVSTE